MSNHILMPVTFGCNLLQLEKSLCAIADPARTCRDYSLVAVGGLLIVVACMGSRVLKEKPAHR